MKTFIAKKDGLAIYLLGEGAPVLLFPYPHASTLRPMAEDKLAAFLVSLGYQVITFDPPGAYASDRPMSGNMAEMLDCAVEALDVMQIDPPVTVVGHSMGGLCALAIERPELVERLALIGACSGFPAVMRWSTPHNWSPLRDVEWWQCSWLGFRQMIGRSNLAVHKRLDNLVEKASFVGQQHVELWTIEANDHHLPTPPRTRWLRTVREVNYRQRLDQVLAQTLVCVGRYDPQTPIPCSKELADGIPNARFVIFEHSGHSPFIEETERLSQELHSFLQ